MLLGHSGTRDCPVDSITEFDSGQTGPLALSMNSHRPRPQTTARTMRGLNAQGRGKGGKEVNKTVPMAVESPLKM